MSGERRGILFGGNLIIDHVKVIDGLPGRGRLATILSESLGTGGAPYNNAVNMSILGAKFPIAVMGKVGRDADGEYILNDLKGRGIDIRNVRVTDAAPTSYTDVMTEKETGERTFFHNRGANALFGIEDIDFDNLGGYKIVHIGYALLLDSLDAADPEHGTVMARVLHEFQARGAKTAIDVVSEQSDRFSRIVTPSLEFVDYLILNELEAGSTTGRRIRAEDGSVNFDELRRAAELLQDKGNPDLVLIHMPEGSYALTADGLQVSVPSHDLRSEQIKGMTGAGDAYASGVLYGLHEGYGLEECMRLGTAVAALCLSDPTCTGGIKDLEETRRFMENTPYRDNGFTDLAR